MKALTILLASSCILALYGQNGPKTIREKSPRIGVFQCGPNSYSAYYSDGSSKTVTKNDATMPAVCSGFKRVDRYLEYVELPSSDETFNHLKKLAQEYEQDKKCIR